MTRWLFSLSVLSLLACGSPPPLGSAAPFRRPMGVAVDSSGNLFVADSGNAIIRKVVLSTGVVTTLAGSSGMHGSSDGTGAAARFSDPQNVAVDGAGNLYIADSLDHTIRKVALSNGEVTTLAGSSGVAGSADGSGAAAHFYDPQGVAVDGAGNLYVADGVNHTVRKVLVRTGAVTTLAGSAGLAGSADGIGFSARFGGSPAVLAVELVIEGCEVPAHKVGRQATPSAVPPGKFHAAHSPSFQSRNCRSLAAGSAVRSICTIQASA